MEQRVTCVTLGVADLERSEAFYRALGWERANDDAEVAFFQAGGMVLALWGRANLAEDGGVEDPGGWGGVTLSQNVRSPDEVDAIVAAAREAGATVGHEPGSTFWGGYAARVHRSGRAHVGDRAQPVLGARGGRFRAAAGRQPVTRRATWANEPRLCSGALFPSPPVEVIVRS